MQTKVWLNRGLSQTAFLLAALKRAAPPGEELTLIASHVRPDSAVSSIADQFEIEPITKVDEYVEFALRFVQKHGIQVVLPHTNRIALSDRRSEFEALGCKVVTAGSGDTIRFLRSKTALYCRVLAAGGLGIHVPEFVAASTKADTLAAIRDMRAKYGAVAIKPSAGLGGHGFRIIHDAGAAYDKPYNGDFPPMTFEEMVKFADEWTHESFKQMMVMPFLGGPEHSLDCFSVKGKLVKAIDRVKFPGGLREKIDSRPDLVESCQRLTELLRLDGLYNVQFLESEAGVPYLLEINARMAGGTYLGEHAGVLLPYWAIRIATGSAKVEDVPEPKTGILIDRATRSVITD